MFVTVLQTVQEGIHFIVILNFKNHRTTDFVPIVLLKSIKSKHFALWVEEPREA